MVINGTFEISYVVLVFAALGAILIGALLAVMHVRRQYHPNLIGALIGALLCFLLLLPCWCLPRQLCTHARPFIAACQIDNTQRATVQLLLLPPVLHTCCCCCCSCCC